MTGLFVPRIEDIIEMSNLRRHMIHGPEQGRGCAGSTCTSGDTRCPEAAAVEPLTEFLIKLLPIDRVDEGIVAGVAHGKQVTGEPDQIDVLVIIDRGIDLLQDVVRLEWEPANREDCYHDE